MAKIKRKESTREERLADLADRYLTGEIPPDYPDMKSEQETIRLLSSLERHSPPEKSYSDRLWKGIASEWQKQKFTPGTRRNRWSSTPRARRTMILSTAAGLALIGIIALVSFPALDNNVTGTATGTTSIFIGSVTVLIIAIILAIFITKKKE
jgi:hypothetical protein